jgi:hypothetical protein
MTPEEILTKAQEHLRKGWCKGNFGKWDGRVCSIGAMYLAAGTMAWEQTPVKGALLLKWVSVSDPALPKAIDFLAEAIRETGYLSLYRDMQVTAFNDDEKTSLEDVLLVFKHATEKARDAS